MSADDRAKQISADDATESSTRLVGQKAKRALRWSVLGILTTRVGSLAIGLVLARLLTPADFGIYAVALAATGFVMRINDVGLVAATVQWRGRLEEMAPTATVIAVLFSTSVYGIFWLTAPAFAALAGSPAAAPLVRLLTAVILIDGVTAVRVGTLIRNFQQDKIVRANIAGFAVNAALAIFLALHNGGPYSFAVGQVGGALISGILWFISANVPLKLGFDRAVALRLVRFGVPLAASLGTEAILLNADYVIVGGLLGATALGFYLLAFNISSWLQGIIGTAVRYVSIPSFSRLAEQDNQVLSLGVQRSIPLLLAGVLPIAMLMAVLAPALVAFLYGSQWEPAVPVLRLLVILAVVRLVTGFAIDILLSAGATRATLWLNIGWAVIIVPALIVGTRFDGIRGTATAHAAVAILIAIPLAMWTLHRAHVQLAPIATALLRPLFAVGLAMATCVTVSMTAPASPFTQLATAGTAGLLTYIVIAVPSPTLRRVSARAGTSIVARLR